MATPELGSLEEMSAKVPPLVSASVIFFTGGGEGGRRVRGWCVDSLDSASLTSLRCGDRLLRCSSTTTTPEDQPEEKSQESPTHSLSRSISLRDRRQDGPRSLGSTGRPPSALTPPLSLLWVQVTQDLVDKGLLGKRGSSARSEFEKLVDADLSVRLSHCLLFLQ